MSQTHYDILGVSKDASPAEIRDAYVRLSFKYHPMRNLLNVEEAKANFVEVGQAYETLSDQQRRRAYDQSLQSGCGSRFSGFGPGWNGASSSSSSSSSPNAQTTPDADPFLYYRDAFDTNIAGMSEEKFSTTVGVVGAAGSIAGAIVGAKMARNCGFGIGVVQGATSLAASRVAGQLSVGAVREMHQASIRRVQYREACRVAQERGQPMPEPPPNRFNQFVQNTTGAIKGAAQDPKATAKNVGDTFRKAGRRVQAASAFLKESATAARNKKPGSMGH
eukprot:Nitzschia sp. Nitz4//scaffold87_size112219//21152//21982//NITZ4_004065-RA/size112219-processed-gene-0.2-mRNA-1//1//CDS//3329559342//831//frame0